MANRELLDQYLARADALVAEAEDLEGQAQALLHQAEKLRDQSVGYLGAADMLRPLLVTEEDDLTGVIAEFTGCTSILERLVRLAQAAEGRLLNTTKAAEFLIAHGQTKSKLEYYRSEVNRALVNNPDVFARVSSGTYRYCGDLPELEAEIQAI